MACSNNRPCDPQSRQYQRVQLGTCLANNFTLAVQTNASTGCRDIWTVSIPVSRLAQCGITVSKVGFA
jgi:hypothetical protein